MNNNIVQIMRMISKKILLLLSIAVLQVKLSANTGNIGIAAENNTNNQPPLGTLQNVAENADEVEKAFQLLQDVVSGKRFINMLDSLYAIDLPIGIGTKDEKGAEKYAIIINDLIVRDGATFLNAYMAFTVPGSGKKIAFKGSNIPFTYSGGVQGIARLDLVSDFSVNLTSNIVMKMKGGGKTYVTWDCEGFKEMTLSADILFDSTIFVPENPDGTQKKGVLKTSIDATFNDWNNLLVAITLDPFQLKPLKGVGFKITNAVLDMSDFINPASVTFPANYQTDYFIEGNQNIWRGFYIQEAQVRLPKYFKKKNNLALDSSAVYDSTITVSEGRTVFYARNLFIDELGFTADLSGNDLMTLDEGDMNGWGFSLENFHVSIITSQLISASFNGQIRIPQFKQNSVFNYTAQMGLNDSYSFVVSTTKSIEMDLWAANLSIDPNSSLSIVVKDGNFLPSLLLNGVLTVNSPVSKDDPNSNKLSIAEIPFQGMLIQTVDPYFSVEYISFGIKQNAFSKFPVSISKVGFKSEGNRVGLEFGLIVNFVGENDGGFGGEGDFTIWGKREDNKWKYDGVEIDRISVDISKPGAFELHGEVLFIRGDSIYGNGFKGVLSAKFASFEMDATALFGNVSGYRYWYADALVAMSTGLPAGPVSIYGFGGGAYYHMKQAGVDGNQGSDIGKSTSGIIYIPDSKSGLGIMASVKFGLSGSQEAFNGDVRFEISFTTSGGLNQIYFEGNGYFATNSFSVSTAGVMDKAKSMVGKVGKIEIPQDAANSALYGKVTVLYDHPNKCFHSTFDIYVNVAGGVIKGVGPSGRAGWGIIHFEPGDWYIHLGTPENPNGISVLGLAKMTNYFMAGKSVPELPAPPDEVLRNLGSKINEYYAQRSTTEMAEGSGFMLGASLTIDTGEKSFLMFYGRLGCGIGFDILMKKYAQGAICAQTGEAPGINGWYAQGQAWAWIAAEVGIKVDLLFYKGKYSILDAEIAALLRAKAPNPFWMKGNVGGRYNILGGLVKGNFDFEFEVGQECDVVSNSPFGGAEIIAEVKPAEGDQNVAVFNTPQAVFNIPVGQEISFTDEYKVTKIFRIKLDQFKVKTSTGMEMIGSHSWNDRYDVVAFKSRDILPGTTQMTVTAEVSFEEKKNGAWYPVMKNGKILTEKKEAHFTTGVEPDYVPQENVSYSYPQYRAFNYFKSESNSNYVKLTQGQPGLFNPGSEWIQQARLTALTGGFKKTIAFNYDVSNTQINIAIPGEIANNTIYRLEIINVPSNAAAAVDKNVKQNIQKTDKFVDGNTTDMEIKTQYAEGTRTELQEKVIYSLEFRTSKYNTFEAKYNSLRCSDWVSWELYPLVHSLTVNIFGERFDEYEVKNLIEGTMVTSEAIMNETPWYINKFNPLVKVDASVLSAIGMEPFKAPALNSYLFQTEGTRKLTDEEITAGITADVDVWSGMKNYISKYTCEYMNSLQSRIANSNLNSFNASTRQRLAEILNADFNPIKYGNYPVNIKYTLPGKDTPYRVLRRDIQFIDE